MKTTSITSTRVRLINHVKYARKFTCEKNGVKKTLKVTHNNHMIYHEKSNVKTNQHKIITMQKELCEQLA